ncbi:MAG: ThuA domain-containing protein [Pseudomonadota bacterium]
MATEALVITRGHPYDRARFFEMLEALPDLSITHVEHPAVATVLASPVAERFQTLLFYDMCGIPGTGVPDGSDPAGNPPALYVDGITQALERGTGFVFLNHATVSWPNWPLWRELTGSAYLLRAGELRGTHYPGSGYRGGHGPHPNPTFRVAPQGKHPALSGLADGFEITDELYLTSRAQESAVLPLLRADYPFTVEHFTPPPLAPATEQANWDHPEGSNLVAWANALKASPVVATMLGDGPDAYGNEGFRTLLGNALRWTGSAAGRDWAASYGGS